MQTIEHLVYAKPETHCDIEAGTFFYIDVHGEECKATFYVRTCAEFDDDERVNDYNGQYCNMYCQLLNEGCTNIRYEEDTASLILG